MDIPAQHQTQQPGHETEMHPAPHSFMKDYQGSGKLEGKKALITGGDSGIGRATAIGMAKEGADIAILYLEEDEDASITQNAIQEHGKECLTFVGDLGNPEFCSQVAQDLREKWGSLDVLVNNAGEQHPCEDFLTITPQQIEKTFKTNFFGMFFLTQAIFPLLNKNGSIVNCTSVTAYRGSPELLDYASSKGAIVAFTRSLAKHKYVVDKKMRVNAVAPGPVWTPLIPASFEAEEVKNFGESVLMQRAAQPDEIAPSFIFLASDDASYMTGQVLHPNGGEMVGS
ncbi:MAG: SDR family oxidoreductase [Pseudomonadota bacterium]